MAVTPKQLIQAANALVAADKAAADAKKALKEANEKSRILREETIPAAMDELELTTFTLKSGEKLSIKHDVYAHISEANRPAAFKWLNDNNFGGLIKTEVKTEFGKGEREVAIKLTDELIKRNIKVQFKENIHPQTLKAFLRTEIENGTAIPMDIFGARPVDIAIIKR